MARQQAAKRNDQHRTMGPAEAVAGRSELPRRGTADHRRGRSACGRRGDCRGIERKREDVAERRTVTGAPPLSFDGLFRRHDEVPAAILRPAAFVLLGAHRLLLALADRRQAIGRDTEARPDNPSPRWRAVARAPGCTRSCRERRRDLRSSTAASHAGAGTAPWSAAVSAARRRA